jgi:polar amino acid transport system substrate-binding protein
MRDKTDKRGLFCELPGVDIEAGLLKVSGNKELFGKLLRQFLKTNTETVDTIKAHLEKKDFDGAGRMAHTVKGVAGNLAMPDLFSVTGKLEKAIKLKRTESLDSLMDEFENCLGMVLTGLERFEINEIGVKKEGVIDSGASIDMIAVKQLINEMAELLESDVAEAMDRLRRLRPHLESSNAAAGLKKLEQSIDIFDTDEALRQLEQIRRLLSLL